MVETEQVIRQAFSKVKEDIQSLQNKISFLEEEISGQKEETTKIISKLEEIYNIVKTNEYNDSTGNKGVKQLSDQSITNQAIKQLSASIKKDENEFITTINNKYNDSTGNKGVKQLSDQSIIKRSINQPFKHIINQMPNEELKDNIEDLNQKLNSIFFKLSKQELKLFLAIYQLEDEGIQVTNNHLSLKMQLSEPCIRSHLSSLFKKNAPISKNRIGNRTNLLSINKEFRALNMKDKLISLFYDSNPNQKTLFQF